MKHLKSIFLLTVLPVMLCGCPAEDLSLPILARFNNQSADTLIVAISTNYPDTIYPYIDGSTFPYTNMILPYKTGNIEFSSGRKYAFDKYPVIQLFVFRLGDYLGRTEEDLHKAHLALRRYELTREWLEEHDWTVTYP